MCLRKMYVYISYYVTMAYILTLLDMFVFYFHLCWDGEICLETHQNSSTSH